MKELGLEDEVERKKGIRRGETRRDRYHKKPITRSQAF
jgi:hypothetical protein